METQRYGQPLLVITNFHVIESAVTAKGTFSTGEVGHGLYVLAEDPIFDLALLQFDADKKLNPLPLSTEPRLPVGTKVYVLGNPLGLENSLSDGLVSGYRRLADGADRMQLTAPISAGSSGSPVLDSAGRVVGVVTSTTGSGQNLNFAAPADTLGSRRKLLPALVNKAV
jgi:serine protease Do